MILTPRRSRTFTLPVQRPRFNVDRYLDSQPQPHPYGWCGRLNDRIEHAMARTDWRKVELRLGTACGAVLTGAAVYLVYVMAAAWTSGAIQAVTR